MKSGGVFFLSKNTFNDFFHFSKNMLLMTVNELFHVPLSRPFFHPKNLLKQSFRCFFLENVVVLKKNEKHSSLFNNKSKYILKFHAFKTKNSIRNALQNKEF